MKKAIALFAAAALMLAALTGCAVFGKKPFADISPDDIASVTLFAVPPGELTEVTDAGDIGELAAILQTLVIYQEDDGGREEAGQLVAFTLTMADGSAHEIGAYGDFLFLDGKCYRTEYQPSQELNALGNRLLSD